MTRQVVARAFGGPEELEVIEVPTPAPGRGQVRISVRAVGVNPYDWKQYSGTTGLDPANLTSFGSELSGVVEAVGDQVEGWAVGDEVIATGFGAGSYADAVVVPQGALYPIPSGMPFPQAAVVSVVGGAAWHTIEATGVREGDTVLVHNGAGGVGGVVVQLALLRGATVVATGGPANQEHLRRLGAVPVVYGPGLLHRVRDAAPGGVDVAIDCIGTDEAVDTSVALVVDRARIATIAAFGRAAGLGIKLLGNGPGADPGSEIRRAGRPEVARLVAEGRLELPIAGTYPLEQTAAAHRESRSGHVAGKLVVIP